MSNNIDNSFHGLWLNSGALKKLAATNATRIGKTLKAPPHSPIGVRGLDHDGGVNNLVEKLDLNNPKNKYLFIYDLDGTIWRKFDNHLVFDFLQDMRFFPYDTFDRLKDLNEFSSGRFKNMFLTARAQSDMAIVDDMHGMDCYCDFGYSLLRTHRDGSNFQRVYRGHALSDKQRIAGDIWQSPRARGPILDIFRRAGLDVLFTGEETGFYIRFNERSIADKEDVIKFVQLYFEKLNVLARSLAPNDLTDGEKVFDLSEPIFSKDGYLVIFKNKVFNDVINKTFGVDFILEQENLNRDTIDPNLKVVYMGDSSADSPAMKRLKELLPANQVCNVRVGGDIKDLSSVDHTLRDHLSVQRFIRSLHRKALPEMY